MSHRNAPLTETGRLRLARCVVEEGWPLRRAAERFQVSPTTAQRWADRYRRQGEAGLTDRSSRPHHSPRRTPTRTERRIIKVRLLRRWGPARIAHFLHLVPSTVHRVLTRYHLARLSHLDRATGRVVRRYERDRPGELVHVDIKKLGNIPDGGGHKVHGRAQGGRNSSAHRDPTRPRTRHGRPNLHRPSGCVPALSDELPSQSRMSSWNCGHPDGMPLPDEDFPGGDHDLRVPRKAVVARTDLVRVAVVVERLEVDGADRRSVGDVLLRIEASAMPVSIYERSEGPFGAGTRAEISLREFFWGPRPCARHEGAAREVRQAPWSAA